MQPVASSKVIGYGGYMDVPFPLSIEPGTRHRSKIIENLAVVNYDTNNLYLAPYDWRLSCWNLEERDGYFSKLQSTIEELKYGGLFQTADYLSFFTSPDTGNARKGKLSSPHTPWDQRFVTKPLSFSFPWADHYGRLPWLISFLCTLSSVITADPIFWSLVLVSPISSRYSL